MVPLGHGARCGCGGSANLEGACGKTLGKTLKAGPRAVMVFKLKKDVFSV